MNRARWLGMMSAALFLNVRVASLACDESDPEVQPAVQAQGAAAQPPAAKSRLIEPIPPAGGIPASDAFTVRSQLIDDPQIFNAHEHVGHDEYSLGILEEANAAVGITRTILLGSPRNTLRLDRSGFIEHPNNNEYICQVARDNPDKYLAFVTFDPLESDIVAKLIEYRKLGAKGVKLYLGHGAECGPGIPLHSFPLDDPQILPLYAYCQSERVPILFHVNLRKYQREMVSVLRQFPNLQVILPHFGLKLGKLNELDAFMTAHPSVLIDISFGYPNFQFEGLERIHNDTENVRNFFVKYQDRIVFGTDAVPTPGKDAEFVCETFLSYRRMLELPVYDHVIKWNQFDYNLRFNGLSLSEPMLRKIYHENIEKFLGL